jgi:hypothetical protein
LTTSSFVDITICKETADCKAQPTTSFLTFFRRLCSRIIEGMEMDDLKIRKIPRSPAGRKPTRTSPPPHKPVAEARGIFANQIGEFRKANPQFTCEDAMDRLLSAESDSDRTFYGDLYNAILHDIHCDTMQADGLAWNDSTKEFIPADTH